MAPIITLTTDFGMADSYVAEMKAVLLSAHPSVRLIDVTHQVAPFDIEEGAFQLLRSFGWFPKQTFHLAVVDPGVGSERKAIYVRTRDYHFFGPDNGVLLWAVRAAEKREGKRATVYEIPISASTGPTFHGRDVFAPFIVGLFSNQNLASLRTLPEMKGRDFPKYYEQNGVLMGQVVSADSFGNLITSVPFAAIADAEGEIATFRERFHAAPNYASIPRGKIGLIRGSHGFWEIASSTGSAASLLKAKKGDKVMIHPPEKK